MFHRENYRVVRFEVETRSVAHEDIKFKEDSCEFSDNARPQYINRVGKTKLFFTYSVEWKQSDVRWASRWDSYLAMSDVQIHWFSIVNSLIVVFFLSGILTMIIIRTLRRDIAKYVLPMEILTTLALPDYLRLSAYLGIIKMTVTMKLWKNLAGSSSTEMYFVPPDILNCSQQSLAVGSKFFAWPSLLSVGIQRKANISIAVVLVNDSTFFFSPKVFAMLGMLSPASRGALMTAAIFLYVFMGLIAGYHSGRLYKTMKGKEWKRAAFLVSSFTSFFV